MVTRRYSVGSDHVQEDEGRVVVRTRTVMLDWAVQPYCRPRVHFRDKEYAITGKEKVGREVVYSLSPWSNPKELASSEIFYDEDYVKERDRARRMDLVSDTLRPFLIPLYAIVGFAPALWKARLEREYGVDARAATRYSVWLEGLTTFSCMVFLLIGLFIAIGGADLLPRGLLTLAILVLAPDTVMRIDSLLREHRWPSGFYEWSFRRRGYFRDLE